MGSSALPGPVRLFWLNASGQARRFISPSGQVDQKPFARGKEARFMRSFEIEFVPHYDDVPCTTLAHGGERAA
jgi:hypothetical protein